jgi:hypothetical protein
MSLKDDFSPFARPGFLIALAVILVLLGAVGAGFWWLTSS